MTLQLWAWSCRSTYHLNPPHHLPSSPTISHPELRWYSRRTSASVRRVRRAVISLTWDPRRVDSGACAMSSPPQEDGGRQEGETHLDILDADCLLMLADACWCLSWPKRILFISLDCAAQALPIHATSIPRLQQSFPCSSPVQAALNLSQREVCHLERLEHLVCTPSLKYPRHLLTISPLNPLSGAPTLQADCVWDLRSVRCAARIYILNCRSMSQAVRVTYRVAPKYQLFSPTDNSNMFGHCWRFLRIMD